MKRALKSTSLPEVNPGTIGSMPMVAIVGRPNVGKSTLFNRLVGRPQAVVSDIPGTTRDRVSATLTHGEKSFILVDTGGLEMKPDSDIRQKVQAQVAMAIQEADVIILMVDVLEGITPADQEVTDALRRAGKPIFLVSNKADNARRREGVWEFYELGLGDPIAISAYHNLGVEELMKRVVKALPSPSPIAEPTAMRIAIVGRPNVGKSMLLNTLLGQERAIVSEMPGTTRDAVDTPLIHDGESVIFIDTAGLRKRGRIERGIESYSVLRAMRAIARSDIALLIIDAVEIAAAQDLHIAGYIKDAAKGIILVVNKWDLAPELGLDEREVERAIKTRFRFMPYASILYTSAKFGQGIKGIIPLAKEIFQQRGKEIAQAQLNDYLTRAVAAHLPSSKGGRQAKIFKTVQTGVHPPTFEFSVNSSKLLHFSYERYLENRLRDAFGFQGTPIQMWFKGKGEER